MAITPLSRRRALQGLAASAFAGSVTAGWARAAAPALTFLAVGDWGREGLHNQAEVARQMGATALALGARFVISVGDNFYEDGVTSVSDPQWKASFEDVYAAPSLHIPWYVALGNHDYRGNSQAQIDYSRTSHRWRLPARWHMRRETAPDGATADLFFLDTSPFIRSYYKDGGDKVKVVGQDTAAQAGWFETVLAASTADWKIVIGHHPIWSGAKHGGMPELQTQFDPLLQQHGVALYLFGHEHDLQHIHHGAVHYVCTGAGSAIRDHCDDGPGSDFCALQPGFTAMRLTRGALQVAYRDAAGAELKVVDIPRRA